MHSLQSLLVYFLAFVSFGQAITYNGADFSSLALLEASGTHYSDSGSSSSDFVTIMASHGANLARIRIWTSTSSSQYSLTYGLALAKRAASAGMALLIDLHYSDTWADPGKQAIPSSWPTTLSGLNTEIYTYTNQLVTAFKNQGTPIQFLQIGNEINNGILWPTGEISVNGYSPLSQLLHSASSGARAASSSVKIVVHLANGWDEEGVSSFYDQIFIAGEFATTDFDVMGFSFYPFYGTGATLAALKTSLNNIVAAHGKDVMIVETDWPVSCSGVALSEPSVPISAAGQTQWTSDIVTVLKGISGGHGIGISYWEPGWVGSANLGSSCADNLLVDSTGKTRTSISMFSLK